MAKRRSSFEKRMSRIQGLSKEDKSTFIRLGEIIDGAINNRGPTNPGQEQTRRIRSDRRLPPPGVIDVELGVRTANLSWAGIDGSLLLHYRVVIQNKDTGANFEFTTFTNKFSFKGQDAGNYRCYVQSIGRGGIASVASGKDFTVPDNVMFLEGNKNGVTTSATFVGEPIYTPQEYTVFVWGAFVMDSFSEFALGHRPTITLRRGPTLEASEPIETFQLFAKNETLTSANDSTWPAPGISRAISTTRSGAFETTHSVLFTPFEVEDEWASQENTFWVVVDDTNFEGDVVSLSITVWVVSGGRGEIGVEVPVIVHDKSILLQSDGSSDTQKQVCRNQLSTASVNGGYLIHPGAIPTFNPGQGHYSVGFWIKPKATMDIDATGYLVSWRSQIEYRDPDAPTGALPYHQTRGGEFRFGIGPVSGLFNTPSLGIHHSDDLPDGLVVEVYPDNSSANIRDENTEEQWIFNPVLSDNVTTDYSQIWNKGLEQWYFFCVVCDLQPASVKVFGERIQVFRDGIKIPPTAYNISPVNFAHLSANVASDISTNRQIRINFCFPGEPGVTADTGGDIYEAFTPIRAGHYPMAWWCMGIWDNILEPLQVATLYNDGRGAEIDWRLDEGAYTESTHLLYLWMFGDTTGIPQSGVTATSIVAKDRATTYDHSRTARVTGETKALRDLSSANQNAGSDGNIDSTNIISDYPGKELG